MQPVMLRVSPIVRGKANANVKFGAKICVNMIEYEVQSVEHQHRALKRGLTRWK